MEAQTLCTEHHGFKYQRVDHANVHETLTDDVDCYLGIILEQQHTCSHGLSIETLSAVDGACVTPYTPTTQQHTLQTLVLTIPLCLPVCATVQCATYVCARKGTLPVALAKQALPLQSAGSSGQGGRWKVAVRTDTSCMFLHSCTCVLCYPSRVVRTNLRTRARRMATACAWLPVCAEMQCALKVLARNGTLPVALARWARLKPQL